ncbi:MAG: class I SAM-dependent methyltransferase, partial [Chlorobiales bacterium]|nr:class I SAM-dependent methyltransferase [Chlorobiales bacterium]
PAASADAVLLMGPLYHFINEHHRAQAIRHCQRILKPGGALFAVFLSPYPVFQFGTESERERLPNGVTYTTFQGYEVPQYRCWPSDADGLMKENGFDTVRIRNLEGIGIFLTEEELRHISTPEQKTSFFATLRNTAEDPERLGVTHQFLYVGTPAFTAEAEEAVLTGKALLVPAR